MNSRRSESRNYDSHMKSSLGLAQGRGEGRECPVFRDHATITIEWPRCFTFLPRFCQSNDYANALLLHKKTTLHDKPVLNIHQCRICRGASPFEVFDDCVCEPCVVVSQNSSVFSSMRPFLPVLHCRVYGDMNGVDRSDQMLANNHCSRKCRKWWKVLFFHLIDIAVVNAFILFKQHSAWLFHMIHSHAQQ